MSFTYDAAGRRVSKTVGSVTTYFLYSGGALLAEVNAQGTVTRSYTWGATGLLGDRVGGQSRFYLFDALGNTRALLGQGGNIIGWGAYTAWGRQYTGAYPANMTFGWKGQLGQYYDAETGLVYCNARYYAPTLGRFVSRDPIGFAGGVNVYAYCGGDPVNYADPSGLNGGQLGFEFVTEVVEQVVTQAPAVATEIIETVAEVGPAVVATEAAALGTAARAGLRTVAGVAGRSLGAVGAAVGVGVGAYTLARPLGDQLAMSLHGPEVETPETIAAAQPVVLASHPERVSHIQKADSECTLQELKLLAKPAENVFRGWLEQQGLELEYKAGHTSPGPDAVPIGGTPVDWAWAELKRNSSKGIKDGMEQIRDRFKGGMPGPAQLYLWNYDGTNFSYKKYGGLRYPK